jgi:hypothetical protein
VVAVGIALSVFLASDAMTVGFNAGPTANARPVWREVAWPFLLDQWGTGRAYRCDASACGVEVNVYVRAKIGFCNCSTGVSDDFELDRVGDVSLIGDRFAPLRPGEPIAVGWMRGRSRLFDVARPSAPRQNALAIAVNDKCDAVVMTVVSGRELPPAAAHAALVFVNTDPVLGWAKTALGL